MSHAKQFYLLKYHPLRVIKLATMVYALSLLLPEYSYGSPLINISQNDGVYQIEVNTRLNVGAHYVRDVLLDVDHIYRLNPSIIESERLASQKSDEAIVRTRVLFCIPVLCREINKVDSVKTLSSGEIQFTTLPELSDFTSSVATWKLTTLDDKQTHLHLRASLTPDFFVPSSIGVDVVREHLITTFNRIEIIAKVNAKRDVNNKLPNILLARE